MILGFVSLGFYSIEVRADAHCFCKITTGNSTGSASPVGTVLKAYSNLSSWNTSIGHNDECETECRNKVNQDSQLSTVLAQAATEMQAGNQVYAYSAVGGGKYRPAAEVGRVPSVIKNFQPNFPCSLMNKPIPSGCILYSGKWGTSVMETPSNPEVSRCLRNQINSMLNDSTQFNMSCHRFIYCTDFSKSYDRCKFEQQVGVTVGSNGPLATAQPVYTESIPLNIGCAVPRVLSVGPGRDTCN